MSLLSNFEKEKPEEFYRKLLLLDKIKPCLLSDQKEYIFNKGYCWDLLFKGEDAPAICFNYAENILKGQFPEGEKYIAKNPWYAYYYAFHVLKGRFLEGEKTIARVSRTAFNYARNVIDGAFILGEETIATHSELSFNYAIHILNNRFLLGENVILRSPWKTAYLQFLEDAWIEHDDIKNLSN